VANGGNAQLRQAMTRSGSLFLITMLAAIAVPVSAKSPIYRCVKDGQTVLTDTPCDTAAATSFSGTAGNQAPAPESIVGQWRGQTQFQGAENGQLIEASHSVVPLALTFSADGKVSGKSADNGCELLGRWAPGVTPRMFTLDITLKNCEFGGLNRRYTGSFIATFPENLAQLSILAIAAPPAGRIARRYDVGATLRR
jgi:hypothetical protein